MKKKRGRRPLTQGEGVASTSIIKLGGGLDPFQGFEGLQPATKSKRKKKTLQAKHEQQKFIQISILLHNMFGWLWVL